MTLKTRVLPGRRIELEAPELTEGELVDVLITPALPEAPAGETAEDWIRRFNAWADSHHDLPELAPYAFERAHFYGDER